MKQPNKILHISDIHVFRHKRHNEHKHLTNEICKTIIDEQIDLCYIGGDIVDSKTNLSPEQIQQVSYFFASIANLVPTIVLPGNHDLLLNAKSGLDSLTPIIDNLTTEYPIYYLTDSGIYNLYNINWVVWSCIDDKDPFKQTPVYNSDYKIGCFHGPVSGCKTDIGFSAFNNAPSVDMFDQTDITLLGDIHLRQTLSSLIVEKDNETFTIPRVMYSGSTLQVDASEKEGRGGIIWQWSDEFKTYIPNNVNFQTPYGFKSFNVVDITKFEIGANEAVENKTIILKYVGDQALFSNIEFRELRKKIKDKFKQNTVIIQNNYKKSVSITNKQVVKDKQVDFIKLFCKRYNYNDYEEQSLKVIDNLYNKKITNSSYNTGEYYIEDLEISNFLCFGPYEKVSLNKIEGISGVFGPNGVGKTSVLQSIMFCLFNKCPKNVPLYKLVNDTIVDDKVTAYVQLILSIKGVTWRIKRTISANLEKKTGKAILEVYEIIDGQEIARHEESRPKTDVNVLRKLLGDELTFLRTCYWEQKNSTEFVDAGNSEKLDLFIQFVGITIYDEKFDLIVKDLKIESDKFDSKKLLLDKLPSEHESQKKANEIKEKKVAAEKSIKEKTKESVKLNKNKDQISKDIELLNVNFKEQDKSLIEKNILSFETDFKTKQKELTSIEIINSKLIETWEKEPLLKGKLESWEKDYSKINFYKTENIQKLKEIEDIEHQLENDTCPTCLQKWKKVDNKKDLEALIIKLKTEIEDNEQLLIDEQNEQKRVLDLKKQINDNNTKIPIVKLQIEGLSSKLIIEKQKLVDFENNQSKLEKKKSLEQELSLITKEIQEVSKVLTTTETELKFYDKDLVLINNQIADYKKILKELKELESVIKTLEIYKKAMHRTGIPALILEEYIPLLNNEMSELIKGLFDFTVEFELEEGYLEVYFSYPSTNKEKGKRFVAQACGMEGIIINLIIRAALTNISLLPKPSLLMLDEVFAQLDKVNIVKMKELILLLKNQYFNILLISHIEDMYDLPENFITLERKDNVTVINQ